MKQYTFLCAQCGKAAAVFSEILAGVSLGPDDLWSDRDRMRREGFMGTSTHFSSPEKIKAIFEVLATRDYHRIARVTDPDLIGFHCWTCGVDYCEDCWEIGPPQFDDDLPGFYDCTEATCPHGHLQIVDD